MRHCSDVLSLAGPSSHPYIGCIIFQFGGSILGDLRMFYSKSGLLIKSSRLEKANYEIILRRYRY